MSAGELELRNDEVMLKQSRAGLFGGMLHQGAPSATGPRTRARLLPGRLILTSQRLMFQTSWRAFQDARIEVQLSEIRAVNTIPIILWLRWLAIETDQEEHWFRVRRMKEWAEQVEKARGARQAAPEAPEQ